MPTISYRLVYTPEDLGSRADLATIVTLCKRQENLDPAFLSLGSITYFIWAASVFTLYIEKPTPPMETIRVGSRCCQSPCKSPPIER